jgi:hypothetical protein
VEDKHLLAPAADLGEGTTQSSVEATVLMQIEKSQEPAANFSAALMEYPSVLTA